MDQFLGKHNIDVGKTAGALLFGAGIWQTYDVFFRLLYQGAVYLDLGIPLVFALALGMHRHQSWARKCMLVLTWLTSAIVLLALCALSWSSGTVEIAGQKFANPSILQLGVTGLVLVPLFVVTILALNSHTARDEFEQRELSRLAP